jgi:outer membrane protein assembly factor BamB
LKILPTPRRKVLGAALLLLLVLTGCGAPIAGESWGNLSTDGRYVYVAYKENVFRVNPASPQNRVEWAAQAPEKAHMYGAPALADDKTLYVGAYNKHVYGFSQTAPSSAPVALSSTVGTDRYTGSAAIKGDIVYIGKGDKGMQAFNRKENTLLWDFSDAKGATWSTPVIIDDTVYFTSLDHNLYALNAADGSLKWKLDLGGAVAGTPLHNENHLYVGTFSNELLDISLVDQKVVNRFATQGWVWGTPTLWDTGDGKILYFADLKGYVYAIDPVSFQSKWQRDAGEHGGAIRGSMALAKVDDKMILYAGSESKYVRSFDALTGQPFWVSPVSGQASGESTTAAADKILSDVVIIGDDIIVTTLADNQTVIAFSAKTGNRSWEVNMQEQLPRLQTGTPAPIASDEPTSEPTSAATSAVTAAPTEAATATP